MRGAVAHVSSWVACKPNLTMSPEHHRCSACPGSRHARHATQLRPPQPGPSRGRTRRRWRAHPSHGCEERSCSACHAWHGMDAPAGRAPAGDGAHVPAAQDANARGHGLQLGAGGRAQLPAVVAAPSEALAAAAHARRVPAADAQRRPAPHHLRVKKSYGMKPGSTCPRLCEHNARQRTVLGPSHTLRERNLLQLCSSAAMQGPATFRCSHLQHLRLPHVRGAPHAQLPILVSACAAPSSALSVPLAPQPYCKTSPHSLLCLFGQTAFQGSSPRNPQLRSSFQAAQSPGRSGPRSRRGTKAPGAAAVRVCLCSSLQLPLQAISVARPPGLPPLARSHTPLLASAQAPAA